MTDLSPKQQALKDEFIKNRGYWSDFWQDVLELDANFFSAYTDFSSVPAKNGHLDPKVREFIYIAIDALSLDCDCVMVLSNRHRYSQGTSVEEKEFDAIQGMLKGLKFEMPETSEHKNELLLPPSAPQALPAPPQCLKSSSAALSIIPEEITSNSTPTTAHWAKLDTMVD